MAVCARVSVLVFYAVFAGGFNFGGGGNMGWAVFQGRARMTTN